MPDVEAVECADALANLLRAGPAAAMTTLRHRRPLGAGPAARRPASSRRSCSRLADRNDYGLLGSRRAPSRARCRPAVPCAAATAPSCRSPTPGGAPGSAGAARALAALGARTAGPPVRSAATRSGSGRCRGRCRWPPCPRRAGGAADGARPGRRSRRAGPRRPVRRRRTRPGGRSAAVRSQHRPAQPARPGGRRRPVDRGGGRARSPLRALAGELARAGRSTRHAGARGDRGRAALADAAARRRLREPRRHRGRGRTHRVAARRRRAARGRRGRPGRRPGDQPTAGWAPRCAGPNCGLLLRPGPVDGEILGVRLPRRAASGPPGRGVLVGDPAWGPAFDDGDPVPIQVAQP